MFALSLDIYRYSVSRTVQRKRMLQRNSCVAENICRPWTCLSRPTPNRWKCWSARSSAVRRWSTRIKPSGYSTTAAAPSCARWRRAWVAAIWIVPTMLTQRPVISITPSNNPMRNSSFPSMQTLFPHAIFWSEQWASFSILKWL